jgi:hypothetical protein
MDQPDNPWLIGLGIALVAIFLVLNWWRNARLKRMAYSGIVVDKKTKDTEYVDDDNFNDSTSTTYFVTLQLDDGKRLKVKLPREIWSKLAVGSRVVKDLGEVYLKPVTTTPQPAEIADPGHAGAMR